MSIVFLRYYLLNDSKVFISEDITKDLPIDNHLLFRYALFYDVSIYYKLFQPLKVDHFKITQQLQTEKFKEFFSECVKNAHMHRSNQQKFFCYTILASRICDLSFSAYINALEPKFKSRIYIEKMLDAYYFAKRENQTLTKINIGDYFYDSFALSDEDYNLIEQPIKRVLGFFACRNYFDNCYCNAKTFFSHYTKDPLKIKRSALKIYDTLLNHRKGKPKVFNLVYYKKIDTKVLNLAKEQYKLKDQDVNYTFDDIVEMTAKQVKKAYEQLNSYFNGNQEEKILNKILQTL